MEGWKLFLAVLATLATVGQFLVALSVYALQRSNERIARRIELMARIEHQDMASTLTVSILSTFGVWIDYVNVGVRDQRSGKPRTVTTIFDAIIPGASFKQKLVPPGLPDDYLVSDFAIAVQARGKRTIAVTGAGGMVSFSDSPAGPFAWIEPLVRKLDEIASYNAGDASNSSDR
jgi:hypothetical protein